MIVSDDVRAKLTEIGTEVKKLLPDSDGNVQFNLSRNHKTPKVNIVVADVTGAKKQ